MNAIERVIEKWRDRARRFTSAAEPHPADAVGALWHRQCADELERLYREVIEPLVAALKDAIDYPGDVLVRGRAEAALAKLEGREDATNGRKEA